MERSKVKFLRDLKKFIRYFYRFIISFLFVSLYGKIQLNGKINIEIKTLNNLKFKNKKNQSYKIYIIKNGRVCTDSVEQVAYLSNDTIIKNISYTQIDGKLVSSKNNFVIKRGTPYFKKYFQGSVLSLVQGASGDNNYFHWMFDILPKIKIISSCCKVNKIDYFYMPKLQEFQKKFFLFLA